MSNIEILRIFYEWKARFQRVKEILAPPVWNESDWKIFSCSLAVLVQRHGTHWTHEGKRFWDMRWKIREGGELVCQIEQVPQKSITVVIGQSGGFAGEQTYIWLWSEFNPQGDFIKDPYFVDGMWKEALVALLLPYSARAGFYLADCAAPSTANVLDYTSAP